MARPPRWPSWTSSTCRITSTGTRPGPNSCGGSAAGTKPGAPTGARSTWPAPLPSEGSSNGASPNPDRSLSPAGRPVGLSVGPLLTQALAHVPPARAADASGLLTTTVQLGQLMDVAILGSVYLTRATTPLAATPPAATHLAATHPAAAMAGTAVWLAALSAAALPAALVMVRGVNRRPPRQRWSSSI